MVTLLVVQFVPPSVIRAPTGPCPEEGLTSVRVGAGIGVVVGVSVAVGLAAGAAWALGVSATPRPLRMQQRASASPRQALPSLSAELARGGGRWLETRAIERLALYLRRHRRAVHYNRMDGVGQGANSDMARRETGGGAD